MIYVIHGGKWYIWDIWITLYCHSHNLLVTNIKTYQPENTQETSGNYQDKHSWLVLLIGLLLH